MAGSAVTITRVSSGPAHTRRLGERLGQVAQAGDVVVLLGGLGAGKTCFVQGLARGLGVPPEERVASPTFNIVLEHAGRLPLYHLDLYRIADASELGELGLLHYLEGAGVVAVEWMDRFPGLTPADHLAVRLEPAGPHRRLLQIAAHGPRSQALQAAWLGRRARAPG